MDTFKEYNKNYLTFPFSLNNNSSLCYLNSLIQSLVSCTIFNEYILKNQEKFIKEQNRLVISFIKIISDNIVNRNSNKYSNENIIILQELIRIKRKENENFQFFGQQDVSECLAFIIESMNDTGILRLFYHKYKCDILCQDCKKIKSIQDDISYQFEMSMDMNLSLLSKNIRIMISPLIDYKCDNCNENKNIYKINRLMYIPPILIINLNKYFNKQIFEFTKNLTFHNDEINKKYIYKLVSVIEHMGNQYSGHYISKSIKMDIDEKQEKIYLCNDHMYSESNLNPTIGSYLLFYHLLKIED
jgi:uncharacterized UBP type Zn finger protein